MISICMSVPIHSFSVVFRLVGLSLACFSYWMSRFRQLAVEEENVMSTDVAAQDDETPPGTPEQGPETSNSLLLFKPLKTTSEPKDTSTPATTNKAKSRPLIMSSALEEEVSEMEQLDFEEDHLLIFPELDEKQALDPSFEEQTEDKKTKGKAKELVAGKGSQKAVVTDERLVNQ